MECVTAYEMEDGTLIKDYEAAKEYDVLVATRTVVDLAGQSVALVDSDKSRLVRALETLLRKYRGY